MKFLLLFFSLCLVFYEGAGFWDTGTTTLVYVRTDTTPRQSFFRWQWTYNKNFAFWFFWWDWVEINFRRRLHVVAGISIDFLCLGTAAILNRRTVLTSANYLDPWLDRERDLRIWALGHQGEHHTPFRYRVWKVTRIYPKSLNPEHWHGPRGVHSPRHDVALLHSMEQIYIAHYPSHRFNYACRTYLVKDVKNNRISDDNELWFAGSGFEYLLHIAENYKIFYAFTGKKYVVDCSKYLPKWWGKFICIFNHANLSGVPNGGGLFDYNILMGLGCFEIRYNEDRVMVFTDLRYYSTLINKLAYIRPGEYYEYAYSEWMVRLTFWDAFAHLEDYNPWAQIRDDLYPLGKKK